MQRLCDDVKENWEDATLALFMRHRRDAGGPDYRLVRRRERPDRVIEIVGSGEEIGVEITRCVLGADAAADQRIVALADALRRELSTWEPGGRVHLCGGDFPDCGKRAVARLVAALHAAILSVGALAPFCDSLDHGIWQHEGTTFLIEPDPDSEGWSLADNHLRGRPGRRLIQADDLDRLILERVESKVRKSPDYPWKGPLVLLVRNPYQAHDPDADMLAAARLLLRTTFREAWLVNHTEGVLDLSPPRPWLVDLLGNE